MHRANESLLESANGSMASVAYSAGEKTMFITNQESTWLRPAFSWKALTLKFRLPSVRFRSARSD